MNQPIDDPVAVVIHEIRGPLGLIMMAAEAAKEANNDRCVQEQCDSIVRTANRLLRITSSLCALADNRLEPHQQRFRPGRLVQDTCADFLALGAPISLNLHPDYLDAEVDGSPVHLEALLQSLLISALEHGESGEPVDLRLQPDSAGGLTLRISNRIAVNSRHCGLGLGRLIADRLAAALHCRVERSADGDVYQVEISLFTRPQSVGATRSRSPLLSHIVARAHDSDANADAAGRRPSPLMLGNENLTIGRRA